MKERPILFNGDMVRAILESRKTQTRRAINPQPVKWCQGLSLPKYSATPLSEFLLGAPIFACPYGRPGDRLWVRETFSAMGNNQGHATPIFYRADSDDGMPWTPSIHMPRWASRITLEITNIRVERLNDISEEDAKAEGLKYHSLYNEWGGVEAHPASRPNCPQWRWYEKPSEAFKYLWESINGPESWQENPWVWVIEFKRIQEAA